MNPVENVSLVEKIADAVLYEGYILYPYRPSAVKNQQRWNFGALCPQTYSAAQSGTEAWSMQTECLVQHASNTTLDIKVRFLHLLTREVGELSADAQARIRDRDDSEIESLIDDSDIQTVKSLEVNARLFQTWQEAVEREVCISKLPLSDSLSRPHRMSFTFPQDRAIEPLRDDESGELAGVIVRRQQAIDGTIEVIVEAIGSELFKVTVGIMNTTPFYDAAMKSRDEALMRSTVSTHTILEVHGGEFISLLDPPEEYRKAVAGCSNIGTYPVLVGEEGKRDCMLSSPIILYDYPQIAPESAGNLYDGTEIDEILTLRIMTLTDEEKREMRGADVRARQILERTESLPMEQLIKMHGVMKGAGK